MCVRVFWICIISALNASACRHYKIEPIVFATIIMRLWPYMLLYCWHYLCNKWVIYSLQTQINKVQHTHFSIVSNVSCHRKKKMGMGGWGCFLVSKNGRSSYILHTIWNIYGCNAFLLLFRFGLAQCYCCCSAAL